MFNGMDIDQGRFVMRRITMTGTTMNVSGSIGYFANYQSVSRKEEVKSFASTISAKAEEAGKRTV